MKQFSLFGSPQEKGAREWATFDIVHETAPGMFRVASPEKRLPRASALERPQPYRGKLFPKPAH